MFRRQRRLIGKWLFASGGLTFLYGVASILLSADPDDKNDLVYPIAFAAGGISLLACGLALILADDVARREEEQAPNLQV